ncbi:Tat pathway signal protein [Pandoraea bronchicola]|uniref:Tat pathway signal protein n=2 Tax=Pandoraea bronchicola TaxID=2508287 RepID=A0A5E5C0C4_9BURK|nr:Tat pathway signal protein [Pandoraea bronchicola]
MHKDVIVPAAALASPMRRRLLQAAALAACLPLTACTTPPAIGGSFVQLWRSHLEWTPKQWRERLTATHALGCKEIFVQWVGIDGEPDNTWMASDALIRTLLDESAALKMGVHLGVPYDERWWTAVDAAQASTLDAYLQRTGKRATAYMQNTAWTKHPAFRGWYLPYELEQYHWATPLRIDKLSAWLGPLADVAIATSGQAPTISTYFSKLPTLGTLTDLWSTLLDRVQLHPMIQDGVGVAGMSNYTALTPLFSMLKSRGEGFDIILELFEELPSEKNDGTEFNAIVADFDRVKRQWEMARQFGATRLVAFAIDPWVLDDTPGSKALLRDWKAALS